VAQQIDVRELIVAYDQLRDAVFEAYDKAIKLRMDVLVTDHKNRLDDIIRLVNNAACTLRGMAF